MWWLRNFLWHLSACGHAEKCCMREGLIERGGSSLTAGTIIGRWTEWKCACGNRMRKTELR